MIGRQQTEIREREIVDPSSYNHPFSLNQSNTLRNGNGYFPSAHWGERNNRNMIMMRNSDPRLEYSRDWDQDLVLHRSRQQSISLRDSIQSSNSLSNSYTTSDSASINGVSQERSIEGNHSTSNSNPNSNWNSNPSENHTTALHRRLRTFLHRHLPQNKTTTIVSSSSLSPSFGTRVDRYETYEGQWRR